MSPYHPALKHLPQAVRLVFAPLAEELIIERAFGSGEGETRQQV
jgi:hypothetical protein